MRRRVSIKTILLLSAAFVCSVFFTTKAAPAAYAEEGPAIASAMHNTIWYTIQVSSSREEQDAARQVAILNTHGLAAVSSYEAVEGKGMWYRVYVGRFRTVKEAEAAASRLKADGIISGYWIKDLKDPDAMPASSETDKVERTIAEKDESPAQEVPLVPSEKPGEPQIIPEDQVKALPPQMPVQSESTGLIVASEENMTAPIQEPLSQTTTPQPGPEDQVKPLPPLLTAQGERTELIVPFQEKVAAPTRETLGQTTAPELKHEDEKLFSVALRFGSVYFQGLDEFTISGPTVNYYFEKEYLTAAIAPSFRLNKSFSLEGSLEKILNAEFNFSYVTLGPRLRLTASNTKALFNLSPYIRGALAWGKMSWDDAPGSFDNGLGWELGTGLDVIAIRSNMKLGLETSYRSIKFGYNIPSGQGVTSSQSKIDFSGFSFNGFLNYSF
jgi:hypothetical protein